MIRIFQPSLGKQELDAVAEVFSAQWPGAGARVKEFERAFARYVGVGSEQVIAITSCTEGLFQAIEALELGPSDEVILPTISFVGAAHAVRSVGARLRLIDVDPRTLNPTLQVVRDAITPQTRAAILLHFGGRSTDIRDIARLLKRKGVLLIEDSACSVGARTEGESYGTLGDIGVWSFDSMKLLVTGDGGMLWVKDPQLRRRVWNRVRLGGVRSGVENTESKTRWWESSPESWGRRVFMNDLTAAIGLVQLRRVESFIEKRREIEREYDQAFAAIPWIRTPPPAPSGSVPYFYWIQTESQIRDRLATYLQQLEIYTTFRYWPIHKMELYQDGGRYPGAEEAAARTLLLPLHQSLNDHDIGSIIASIEAFRT